MSAHDVVIRQLATYGTKSFINVTDTEQGHLALRGNCLVNPTYLMVKGNEWMLVVFDSKGWADEGLDDWTRYYDDMWEFTEDGLKQIIGTKDAS